MDPKVYGKLLTHHQRGYGVDVEALHDRIPLRQIAPKGPKMGSHGYRKLRRWKSGFVAPLEVFGVYENIQVEEIGRWSHEGPTRVGGALPPRHALRPCGCLVASLTCTPSPLDVFWSKKNHLGSFIPFALRLVFLFCETLKQTKNQKLALSLG